MSFTKTGDDKLNWNFGDAFQLKADCSKLLDLSAAKSPWSLCLCLCLCLLNFADVRCFLVHYMEALKICASNGSFMEAFVA